jgi:hypothetical protein
MVFHTFREKVKYIKEGPIKLENRSHHPLHALINPATQGTQHELGGYQ